MANFFDQFDTEPALTAPGGIDAASQQFGQQPQGAQGGNFFDQFDESPAVNAPGGMGIAFDQFAAMPAPSEADQRRMGNLASAYSRAPAGRGMAVDSRAQAMAADTQNNNPYLNATMQGLTIGLGDELGAGIRTGLGQGDYGENLAVEREVLSRQRQERPWGMMGAEIVGAAIPAMLTGGVSVAARALPQAPGWLARTADAAINGGLWGGAYGAGTGEGVGGRLQSAGEGALMGAGAGAVLQPVVEGAMGAGRAAVNAAGDYIAPFTQAGRERLAATTLRESATDPAAFQYALENPEQVVPSVPGSRPTTFQQTGDMGIGALERRAETLDSVPFQQRRADQNSARVDYLQSIQREGSPEAVVNTLRQNLADIDRMTGEALEGATATARQQTAALGGAGAPEGYGATIRQQLGDARSGVKARERELWAAVDPDNSLALDASGVRDTVVSVLRDLPKAAKPMEGEEQAIFAAAARFNGGQPFSELTALRSRVSTEMRKERMANPGESPAYRRLSILRGAIEDSIEGAVANKAAQEAQAVASGAMSPDDTMLAKWATAMQAGKETWLADRAGRAGQEAVGYSGGYEPAGSRPVSFSFGGQGQGRGGFDDAAGAQGIPGNQPRSSNFDDGATARLKEASAATKSRAQTYDQGPVGDVLRRSGSDGPYNTPAAVVPERFFRRGAMGAEGMRALQQAANSPETIATMRDYAISNLRKFAESADGTLDPSKVTIWRKAHSDALRALPEIDGMLRGPVEAAEAVAQLAVNRKAALDAARSGAIGRLIDAAPEDVTRKLGAVFSTENPTRTMRMLARETSRSPEAREGLRKGIADWLVQRFISNTEAGTSGQGLMRSDTFQQFMRQNEAALGVVFKPGEVAALKAIAADLQQANRSVTAVKLPGRSNTAQDVLAAARDRKGGESWLSRLTQAGTVGAQAGAGALAGGWTGAGLAVVGGSLLSSLRRAGLQKVDAILADALLNPGRAAVLLRKAPANPTPKDIAMFANAYRRAAFASVIAETDGDDQSRR